MSQAIPGGRPRASSDGDILDESFCGALSVDLNDRHNGEESRKNSLKTFGINNNNDCLDSINDACDSDGEISSHSQSNPVRSRKRNIFFKSMRKAVSRAFVKESKDSTVKRVYKLNKTGDITKAWTPDLRNLGEKNSAKTNGNDSTYSGTMSRFPSINTDPNLGSVVPKWKKTPGTVGIYNHGNSCFMNTVLQCLSNTDSFAEYFIRDFYKNDLKNSSNSKKGVFRSNFGEVTEQLGHLLKCLWSGKYTCDVSKDFKAIVGKFNSQYKGDHQHDAQEFLLWLLDRIHEDVSTNKKNAKPQKASVLKSDEELASEAALVNGESFVLKLFQALHSSTLTCPTCGERSSTFDPYLCVSLPLPQKCPRNVFVIVVFLNSHHFNEAKMVFTMNQFDAVKELRERVSADVRIPSKQLLLVQIREDGFGATYSDDQPISDIPENELVYAFESYSDDGSMQSSIQEFGTPTSQLLVMHVEAPGGTARSHRFGSPALLRVRRDINWKDLQKEILLKMEDSVCEEIMQQLPKLSNLFMLRLYDGSSRKNYLPSDVDMPLYTQSVERAYTTLDEDFGPSHIKIVVEWDSQTKKTVVRDDKEHIGIHPSVAEAQNNLPGQSKVSLDECFKLYTQEEKLIGDDAWLCPHCKQQQQGTIKSLRLWSLPDVLVLHLKRFKETGRSKLNTLVEFPIENLDMSAHLSRPSHCLKRDDYCYDLLGVSNHYGNMSGGHYTAYCRSPVDGEWREFNDNKVYILDGPIATREAYLLFYQRRSLSKDVNNRLFTGDHWVFSLPLAPSEMLENSSDEDESPVSSNISNNQQSQRSRSRSASPSAHPQSNKDGMGSHTQHTPSRPLTPQPFRRPMISYTDDRDFDNDSTPTSLPSPDKVNIPRRSRPVQRQTSAPGSQFRREKSASAVASLTVKLKEPSRTLYNRRSLEVDQKDLVSDQIKKPTKTEQNSGISRSQSQSRSKQVDKPSTQVTVIKHELPKSNDLSLSTSKTISHQASLNNNGLESDAKYPVSYDFTKYLDNRKTVSHFEPASMLQVKYEDDGYSSHQSKKYESSLLSENESARRKLAQLIKPDTLHRALADINLGSIDTIEEESNFVRNGSRLYDTQKSLELARSKPKEFTNDVKISQASVSGHSFPSDSYVSDASNRDIGFKRDKWHSFSSKFSSNRGAGYSLLEEPKDYFIDLGIEPSLSSDFRSKLQDEAHYQDFRRLAEKHFGESDELDHGRANYRNKFEDDPELIASEYISPHLNGHLARTIKFATISRTSDTSQAGRHDRSVIPRSSTDHNIHYNNPTLAAPPSPTPPHSFREEQTFNHATISTSLPSTSSDYLTSNRLSSRDREISTVQSYDFTGRNSNNHSILVPSKIQTLPGYLPGLRDSKYKFRRPRGTWGVNPPKPAPRTLGSIPTPCLRESSV